MTLIYFQDTGSFLAISFGTVLVQIKRNFDKFMQLQQRSIEESRASRKQKCGILSFISNFANFVTTTEAIFKVVINEIIILIDL